MTLKVSRARRCWPFCILWFYKIASPKSMVIIRWILLPALSLLLFFSVHILYGGCNFSGDWDEVLTGTDLPMSFSKKVKSLQENWMDDGDWTSCGWRNYFLMDEGLIWVFMKKRGHCCPWGRCGISAHGYEWQCFWRKAAMFFWNRSFSVMKCIY